jgi:hypothetical protein
MPARRPAVSTDLLLQDCSSSTLTRVQAEGSGKDELSAVRFESDDGDVYTYDPAQPIGARGRFGQVFAGHDSRGDPVAVKRVDTGGSSIERRQENRILAEREVTIATALGKSPGSHLVPLLASARRESDLLLVMPRASESLDAYIAQHAPMDSVEVADILKQLSLALQELASVSVIHRDIKPSNVLRLDDKWALADFGISRNSADSTATLTWAGTGTLDYRAPELWLGELAGVASDFYALGCVAFEMLTGNKAFPGPDFKEQHQVDLPPLPENIDPGLRTLVLDLLAKRPASRPSDARRIYETIASWGNLSTGQHALQRMRLRTAQKQAELSKQEALAARQRERQDAAYEAAKLLWRNVAEATLAAVPDAATEGFIVTVGDSQVRMDATQYIASNPDLVFVGELIVVADTETHTAPFRPANIVCTWKDAAPRWSILRFPPPPGAALPGVAKERSEVVESWSRIEGGQLNLQTFEVATPELILQIFGEAVDTALENAPENGT